MKRHERRFHDARRGCLYGDFPCVRRIGDPADMKQRLLDAMERRMKALNQELIRDFGGSSQRLFEYREVKYWKEAIERGEFDVIIDKKPGYADLDD